MKIAVIDGQGGGIGKLLVDRIRKTFQDDVEILAFGTNSMATSLMVKAGANEGATGENAIKCNVNKVDVIVGTISTIIVNAMMGEVTPTIAETVSSSKALKLLLPLNRSNVSVIGSKVEPLPHLVDRLINQLKKIKEERSDNNV